MTQAEGIPKNREVKSPGHCYWAYHEDGSCDFIPHCYGGIYGPGGCTCVRPGSEIEQLREQNERMAKRIASFRRARGQSQKIYRWYRRRMDALRERLDKYEPRTKIRIDPE